MKIKKWFSIIELLTVVLVILLLISLLIPTLSKLKLNARSALCKSQLRQMGILFNSYASDNNGFLPNDLKSDIPRSFADVAGKSVEINNEFYRNWNGHLLPYIDHGLKNYHRAAKVRKDGEVYAYDSFKGGKGSTHPKNELDDGWIVIRDACHNGGYNDLKVFICPEIHASTFDIGISANFNGLKIPRVSDVTHYLGFTELAWDYLGGGIPTTYIANDVFFGFDGPYMGPQMSLKMDDIHPASSKALLIEGGLTWARNTNGEPGYVYYRLAKGDLGINGMKKDETGYHNINYVHDEPDRPFWLMEVSYYTWFPTASSDQFSKLEIAKKFNQEFAGRASMILNSSSSHSGDNYSIISFIDPSEKPFDAFIKTNNCRPLTTFKLYDELEFHYMIGSMNVLFGDGAVATKDQTWLSQNRMLIAKQSAE